MMEVAGLDPDEDISKRGLGVGESAQAIRDGSIDAFFWSGGVPTAAITDLVDHRRHPHPADGQVPRGLRERVRRGLPGGARSRAASTPASTTPSRRSASRTC